MRTKLLALVPTLSLLLLATVGSAAGPNTTRVTVDKLHCAGCAKKIGAKLYEMPGVTLVEYDVKARHIFVTPQANKQLSPRQLWECIEKTPGCPEQSGYQPVLLEGPHGKFAQKPNL